MGLAQQEDTMTLMTLPTTVNSTNYKLLPAKKFYTKRQKPVLGVVLHITAGLQDLGLVGTDESAEGTIKWALSALPEVSWHAGCDTDGVELCLPDWYTAWHAKGVNSCTVGLEISKLNVDWTKVSDAWIERTLRNAAKYLAAIVKKYDLPLTLQTSKASVDSAIAANRKFGFVYHSTTSAGTRSDPGKNFPIERLFKYIREELAGTTSGGTVAITRVYSGRTQEAKDAVHAFLNSDAFDAPDGKPENPFWSGASWTKYVGRWVLSTYETVNGLKTTLATVAADVKAIRTALENKETTP